MLAIPPYSDYKETASCVARRADSEGSAAGVGSGRTIPFGAKALVGLSALIGLFALAAAWITPVIGDAASVRARVDNALSRWSGGDLVITGPVELTYLPTVSLKASGFILTTYRVPVIERIEAEHAAFALSLWELLNGRLVITDLTLTKPLIKLKDGGARGGPALTASPQEKVAALLLDLPVDNIHINDGVVAFRTAAGQQAFEDLDADLAFNGSSGGLAAKGRFHWKREPVDFALRGGRIALGRREARVPVRLTVSSSPITAQFDGNVRAGSDVTYDGRLDVSLADVRRSLRWWGFAIPDGVGLKGFHATGRMQWSGTTIAFEEGTYAMDGNTAVGTLAAKIDGERPKLEGTLAFEQLSLQPYLTPAADLRAINPIDLPLIHHFDADVRVSANRVDVGALSINEAALTVTMANDVLQGEFAELSVCGGAGNGKLTIDSRAAVTKLRVDGVLNGVTPDNCIGNPALEGSSNVRMTLAAEGRTGEELIASASGEIATQVTQGEVEVDLPRLISDVYRGVQYGWSNGGRTAFDSLTVACQMQNGHIYCPELTMKLPSSTVVGRGGINLPDQNVDWTVSVQGEIAGSSQGAPQAGQKGLLISGPWNEPTIRPPLASTGAADPRDAGRPLSTHAGLRLAPTLPR